MVLLCEGMDDDVLVEYLYNTGLGDLYKRVGGFDCPVTWNWYDGTSAV